MLAGFFTVLTWYLFKTPPLYAVAPGICANFIFLLASHYLLKHPGGFKDNYTNKNRSKGKVAKTFNFIKSFNILRLFNNILPKQETTYIYLGLFIMISTHFDVYFVAKSIATEDKTLYNSILIT